MQDQNQYPILIDVLRQPNDFGRDPSSMELFYAHELRKQLHAHGEETGLLFYQPEWCCHLFAEIAYGWTSPLLLRVELAELSSDSPAGQLFSEAYTRHGEATLKYASDKPVWDVLSETVSIAADVIFNQVQTIPALRQRGVVAAVVTDPVIANMLAFHLANFQDKPEENLPLETRFLQKDRYRESWRICFGETLHRGERLRVKMKIKSDGIDKSVARIPAAELISA